MGRGKAAAIAVLLVAGLAGTVNADIPAVEPRIFVTDVDVLPCRRLTESSAVSSRLFIGLSGDLCDMVLNAPACDVPTGRVFNGAAVGAGVFALPDEFFARFADARGLPHEPVALQRYDSVLLREDTCALTQADLFTEDDLDLRQEIAVAHLIVIHELAHIVDYRVGYSLSERLEHLDIERGLGHAHGDNEFKELFAFCAAAIQWRTNYSLPIADAMTVRLATRGLANGMISWRCPSENRAAVNDILTAADVLPVDPYLTP